MHSHHQQSQLLSVVPDFGFVPTPRPPATLPFTLQGHAVISNKGILKVATNDYNAITTGICGLFVLSIFLTLSVTTKTATAGGIRELSSSRVVQ